jgi:hypothetical protein
MPRHPSPAQSDASIQNGKRSQGRPASGARETPAFDPTRSELRAQTIALAHESIQRSERGSLFHDYYQPQSPVAVHYTNECARASLLNDRVDQFREAELAKQIRTAEGAFNRRQIRRVRYLQGKLDTRPAEAVEQLLESGQGVDFLGDCFEGLADAVRTHGFLAQDLALEALHDCGCTEEPASIGRNPLAYTIQINNLGCTPGVPPTVIEQWLEPIRRPAALRDLPRHELIGADPDECSMRLLQALESEHLRLRALAPQVREELDHPKLAEALNRASILTDASARRAARSHTEGRVTFIQSSRELFKVLDRDAVGPLSFVPGPLSSDVGPLPAGNGPAADAPPESGLLDEMASVEGEPEGEGDWPVGVDQGLPMAPDDGPMAADRRTVRLYPPKPENGIDAAIVGPDKTVTYVDARVSDEGCAKMRKTAPEVAGPEQTPGPEGHGADDDNGATGADELVRLWTSLVPLSACRREGSLLTGDPGKEAAALAQAVQQTTGYADVSALRAGDATPELNRDEALPPTAPGGAEPDPSALHASGTTLHDPLAALIGKYQKEFDAELRAYDHLE